LATIADAYDVDTNEAVSRLIDGFFSSPHTDVGKHVQQTMATGQQAAQAAQLSTNPLIQIFQGLPPDAQQALIQKVLGGLTGEKGGGMGF